MPQVQSHKFFVKDDEIVLVSSSDRRVADVIKEKPTDYEICDDARENVVRLFDCTGVSAIKVHKRHMLPCD